MEATIEAHAPGFRELILARRVWTPVDLEAANANVVGGDINGGSFAIDQQLLFRPGLDWWRWGTPVKGLYLAGAFVPPGAGVHGACGDLAARQAVADRHRPAHIATTATAAGAGLVTLRITPAARTCQAAVLIARGGRTGSISIVTAGPAANSPFWRG